MASARAVSQSGWNSARVGASLGTRRVPSSAGRPNMPRSSRSASITLTTPVADAAQCLQPVEAEQLVLAAGLGHVGDGDLAGLELDDGDLPRLVGLPQGRLVGVEVPVGVVEVPVGELDVGQHEVDVALELGPLLVEADARDQDALDARLGQAAQDAGVRQQLAGRAGLAQLVDLHAEALQQRLLERELHRRLVRRVDARPRQVRRSGRARAKVMPATPPVGNGLKMAVLERRRLRVDGGLAAGRDQVRRAWRWAGRWCSSSGWCSRSRRTWTATARCWRRRGPGRGRGRGWSR